MRSPCRLLWLFGMCLAGTAGADPAPRAESGQPPLLAFRVSQKAGVPGALRISFAESEEATRVGFCLGFVAQISTSDWPQLANAVADLEVRREHLQALVRDHAAPGPSRWHALDEIHGDTAVLCSSVPVEVFNEGLQAMLEVLRSETITYETLKQAVARWQNHEGLARFGGEDSVHEQAHSLAWLGTPEAGYSITNVVDGLALRGPGLWRPATLSNPPLVAMAVAGRFDAKNTESTIRNHRWVRLRQRSVRAPSAGSAVALKRPEHTYPRFARATNTQRTYSSWIFSWPVAPMDERHALGLRAIAWLLEQRLNRTLVAHDDGIATCELQRGRGYGTLQLEIRANRPRELAWVEERVFGAIEQLRQVQVSSSELESMSSSAMSRPGASGDFVLDQALHMAQEALFSWNVRAASSMTESNLTATELQQWVKRDLSRNNLSEVVSETVAPRPPSGGVNPTAPTAGQRQKLRTYTVGPGESLQMIAHKFRVTITELIRVNHLRHPDQISPGTKLFVPMTSTSTPSH
jgi:LysM repeat protein